MATSLGVKAITPTTNVTKPATTLAPSQTSTNTGIIKDPVTGNSYAIGTSGKYEKVAAPPTDTPTSAPSYPGLMGANIQAKTTPTYPGLITNVADTAGNLNNQAEKVNTTAGLIGSQGQVTKEEQAAKNKLAALPGVQGAVTANIENHPSDFAFQMGREAVAGRNIEAMRQALADQATAYATTRQANTQAYTGQANAQNAAGGLIQGAGGLYQGAASSAQPQLGSIGSQQYYNPLNPGQTGATGGGALASLPQQAQDAVNSYASQVQNGSMTRADAESRLSAYGITGTNALNEALGNNFNTNASNASAATTATGQQIKTAADSTNKALDTLSQAFSSLPVYETGGIPATNSVAQWIGKQFGSQALQTYLTNLADARSQLIGVLNSSGGTPTGNESTANQYLPDNMTKAQFDANVGTVDHPGIVRQLISQKVSSFTGSGQQSGNTSNAPVTTKNGLVINPSL